MSEASNQFSISQLACTFVDNDSYFRLAPKYRKFVITSNVPVIVQMLRHMHWVLSDENQDPYSKLLVMRFIKDCISKAEYSFLTLLNSLIAPVIFDVALFRKESKDDQRGHHLFEQYTGSQKFAYNVKQVGLSYLLIILETYTTVRCLQTTPFNESLDFCLPSRIYRQYETLQKIGVKFPEQPTYYKLVNKQRILNNYTDKFQSSSSNMNKFYDYLGEQLVDPESFDTIADLMVGIVRTGDRHCVRVLTELISQQLHREKTDPTYQLKFDYMVLADRLFMSGDIEAIRNIKDELLVPILENLLRKKQPYHQKHYLWIWGFLTQSQRIQNCESLVQISNSMLTCEITIDNIFKNKKIDLDTICEQFHQNYVEQKRNNELKLSKMVQMKSEEQRLMTRIMKLLLDIREIHKQQSSKSKKNAQPLHQSQQSQHQQQQQTFIKIIKDKVKSKVYESQIMIEEDDSVIIMKESEQLWQSNGSEKSHGAISSPLKFKSPRVRTIGLDDLESRSSRLRQDIAKQNNLIRSRINRNSRTKKKGLSLSKTFNECFSSADGSIDWRSIHRQEQIKSTETYKQESYLSYTLKKMRGSQLEQKEGQLMPNQTSQQTPKHNRIKSPKSMKILTEGNEYYRTIIKPKSDPRPSAQPFDNLPVKTKKQILKRKCLVLKNADLQIGLITHPQVQGSVLEVKIYVTTFFDTSNIRIELINPEWLKPNSSYHQTKNAKKQTQSIAIFPLTVNCNLNQSSYCRMPRITVTYTLNSGLKSDTLSKQLPIFITNSVLNMSMQLSDFEDKIPKMQQLSSQTEFETKIVGSFKDFVRYFPNGRLMSDQRIYCTRLKLPNSAEYYLILKLMHRNRGVLKFVVSKQGLNKQFDVIVFRGFCFLLGV